ncbi:MAG: tripartite tricarboxylate transporter permease [Micropepsaceae bacterium]
MFDIWLSGFLGLLEPTALSFLIIGMFVGLAFGAIPGLGGTTALALLIPMTYGMEPITALALAGGVMGSVPMGGSITAILLNTPGTAPNAAACLDGYPLAQQGKGGLAIGASASANALGGIIGTISVLLVIPIARDIVLIFGPPEFFLLAVLGLVVVSTTSRGKMLRSLLAGAFGLMLAFVGYSNVSGVERFTFGNTYLWDGIHLVPALIGLFAIAEMIHLSVKGGSVSNDSKNVKIIGMRQGMMETFNHMGTVVRGSLIGTVVGAVPGVGGTVASFMSYSMTMQASKDPDSFGKGNIQGVIAPEAAINAKDGSMLIPTLAFGIPGSAEMAVFLGLLVLHGMQPGPLMLIDHQVEIYGLIWALAASCVMAAFVGLLLVRPLAMITLLDVKILVPIVVSVAMIGSYAVDLAIENVILTAIMGGIGYMMIRYDYSRLVLVVALVLGPTAERSYFQSMLISDGSWSIFFERIPSLILSVITILLIAYPIVSALLGRGKKKVSAGASGAEK